MRVVLAPDKFKGSLSAVAAAKALADGLCNAHPGLQTVLLPIADGGEGTVDAAVAAGFSRRSATVSGPTGLPLSASFAIRGDTAVVEMALASGLAVLPDGVPAPLTATSRGTGELILAALDAGCRTLVLGVGGSACTDGGTGMIAALGAALLEENGKPVPDGGGALTRVASIDLSALDSRIADTEFILASDVDNPLLGPDGAAAVFGPQKAAGTDDVATLEAGLEHFAQVLGRALGQREQVTLDGSQSAPRLQRLEPSPGSAAAGNPAFAPGAGAAGGVGYAAMAVLNARRKPGVDVVMELLGVAEELATADAVVTGEGSLDEQSLGGKAPLGVGRLAAAAGIPAFAVCGRLGLPRQRVLDAGFAGCYALTDLEPDAETCIANAGPLLEKLASRIEVTYRR